MILGPRAAGFAVLPIVALPRSISESCFLGRTRDEGRCLGRGKDRIVIVVEVDSSEAIAIAFDPSGAGSSSMLPNRSPSVSLLGSSGSY